MTGVLLLALLFPISGRVKDSLGDPIPGARVRIGMIGSSDVIATNRTDENGRFSFPGFFAGSFDVNVEKEGFHFQSVTNLQTRPGRATVLSDIVMEPGIILDPEIAPYYVAPIPDSLPNGTSRPQVPPLLELGGTTLLFQPATGPSAAHIYGRVLDPTGAPMPKATVQISATGDWAFLAKSETDENGRFIFSGLTAGTFDLYFRKEGFRQSSIMNVKAPAGQLTTASDAVLHAAAMACPLLIQVALPYYVAPIPDTLATRTPLP